MSNVVKPLVVAQCLKEDIEFSLSMFRFCLDPQRLFSFLISDHEISCRAYAIAAQPDSKALQALNCLTIYFGLVVLLLFIFGGFTFVFVIVIFWFDPREYPLIYFFSFIKLQMQIQNSLVKPID